MVDIARLRAVKKAAKTRLLSIPGVHGVGIGAKITAGRATTDRALIVAVVEKKALADLPPNQVIPPVIDGVRTDVIEVKPFFLAATPVVQDSDHYDTLVGGIQIQAARDANVGTLGCIAQTPDSVPTVVALTCAHVVGRFEDGITKMAVDNVLGLTQIRFTTVGLPGSFAVVGFIILPPGATGDLQPFEFYVRVNPGDTVQALASTLANEINAVSNPNVSASTGGTNIVTLTLSNQFSLVEQVSLKVISPQLSDPKADLHVTVTGDVIALSGAATGDNYGVYTTAFLGGGVQPDGSLAPNQGTFTAVSKGQSLESIASAIAAGINALNAAGISASASGVQVTIPNLQMLECIVTSDTRVGQPTASFKAGSCKICDLGIGQVRSLDGALDAAAVQLNPGVSYSAEVQDIGAVTGSHVLTDLEGLSGTYAVTKRGIVTLVTTGVVVAPEFDGISTIVDPDNQDNNYGYHRFENYILVQSSSSSPFGSPGDSGSAVLSSSSHEVIGFLSGSNGVTQNVVAPIKPVLDLFGVAVSTQSGVVPQPASSQGGNATTLRVRPDMKRLAAVEAELATTTAGKAVVDLVRRHALEVRMLVNRRRGMIVTWNRSAGPELIGAVIRAISAPDGRFPETVKGKSFHECLGDISAAFRTHGSPQLAADFEALRPLLAEAGGKPLSELLARLREGGSAAAAG